MRFPKLIKITFLLMLSLTYCQKADYKLFSNIDLHPTNRKGSFASKQTIEGLLYEIWDSGFMKKNNLIKREILNNAYGVFRKAPKTLSEPEGRAYYHQRDGQKDLLMLNDSLFGHVEPAPKAPHLDKVRIKRLDKEIRATLVHELFHDFWHNVLDKRKRYLFEREAEIFFIELILAKTKQDKSQLLDRFGHSQLEDADLEPFEILLEIHDIYDHEKVGTELYSTLAGRAYAGKTIIPKPFRKYYRGLLSDTALNRDPSSLSDSSAQSYRKSISLAFDDLAELTKLLDEHPELLHAQDENGFTLLHHATYSGHWDIIQFLIKKGADLNAEAAHCGWAALFLASLRGHREMAEQFIENGALVDIKDNEDRSPLHIAAQYGHKTLVELLLQHGARIDSEDTEGMTPLHAAALSGQQETAFLLVSKGASPKHKDMAGQTPLHLASIDGSLDVVELLIAEGAKIDERDYRGDTALHIASFCGHKECVALLLKRGAEFDMKNINGETPLKIASEAGHQEIVEMLRGAASSNM